MDTNDLVIKKQFRQESEVTNKVFKSSSFPNCMFVINRLKDDYSTLG